MIIQDEWKIWNLFLLLEFCWRLCMITCMAEVSSEDDGDDGDHTCHDTQWTPQLAHDLSVPFDDWPGEPRLWLWSDQESDQTTQTNAHRHEKILSLDIDFILWKAHIFPKKKLIEFSIWDLYSPIYPFLTQFIVDCGLWG